MTSTTTADATGTSPEATDTPTPTATHTATDESAAPDGLRAAVVARAEALADELDTFSRDLHAHPEVGFVEFRSVAAIEALLARHGVALEVGTGGLPTAFRARAGSTEGPQVVITAEYDALPGVGHGCGHNVIAASSLGAFLSIAPLVQAGVVPGGVTLLGTPAEEGGGGKELLIRAGALDGFDASIMVHPGGADVAAGPSAAKRQVVATFQGRTAHAAANPHLGRNALDAAVTAYQSVAQLRQHILPTDRVHGVFLEAGTRPNIVPERAVLEFFLRSRTVEGLVALSERVEAAFRGAALAAGVEVDVVWDGEPVYLPQRINATLAEVFAAHSAPRREVLSVQREAEAVGSSDVGNVSHLLPTIQPTVAIGDPGIPGHSRERADSTLTPDGRRAIVDSAIALALTAASVLDDPALREAAWAEFREAGDPVRVDALFPGAPWPDLPTPPVSA
ncbi:M20 family metallopeptidase [Miniimonas arenae]|uniref:Peptidase M20 domain-containing protein 2 n=1 Tax=Miniimonas arenae TaxID=676201 RepID=A0A5C5BCJ9_9MICO|nr:amidohydrolase [Miniimonas arenae]TNU74799.1 M20 family metallopeptidase [Miniimonas arenae]